jgi:hypothetical protein
MIKSVKTSSKLSSDNKTTPVIKTQQIPNTQDITVQLESKIEQILSITFDLTSDATTMLALQTSNLTEPFID